VNHRMSASIALGVLLAAGTAWAHHSSAVYVDQDKRVTLTGTLTKVDWRNPHVEFSLEVKSDKGQAESWRIESGPPNRYAIEKISKADFEKAIGQTVTVEVSPARDGSREAGLWKITFPDGRVFDGAYLARQLRRGA
jgi:Family of unknown function (DUF6152)